VLKAFLKPVEAEEDDKRVDCDWVCHHGPEVKNDLLERVEQIEVDCVEACLGAGTAAEKEGIDISDVPFACAIYEDGSKDGKPDNIEV
jgi:hypothetical protein